MDAKMPTDAEIAILIARGERMRAEVLSAMLHSALNAVVEMFTIPRAYRHI